MHIILNCLSNTNCINIKTKFVKNHMGQLTLLNYNKVAPPLLGSEVFSDCGER